MVNVQIKGMLETHFKEHLPKYKNEHAGEWLILSSDPLNGVQEQFYKTEEAYGQAIAPYRGTFGPGIVAQRIPLDLSKSEYNLEIHLEVDWHKIERMCKGAMNPEDFIKKAREYSGQFSVHKKGYLSSGFKDGLETKIATLNPLEPSNIEGIIGGKKGIVHAHLKNGVSIRYNHNQIIERPESF